MKQRGFSLVELLVALGVLALVAGVAATSAPRVRDGSEREAARLAMRLDAAMREAAIGAAPLRVTVEGESWRIESFGNDGWRIAAERATPGIALVLESVPAPLSGNDSASRTRGDNRVTLDPLGLGAPFAVRFDDGRARWRMQAGADGAVTTERDDAR